MSLLRTIYHLSNLFGAVVSTAHFGESKRSVRCAAGKRSLKSFVMVLARTATGQAAVRGVPDERSAIGSVVFAKMQNGAS